MMHTGRDGISTLSRLIVSSVVVMVVTVSSLYGIFEHPEIEQKRRMVLFFEVGPDTTIAEQDLAALYESLLIQAAAANPDAVVILESPVSDVLATRAVREEIVRQVDGDSWLDVRVFGSMETLRIQSESFDVLRQERLGQTEIIRTIPTTFRDLTRPFWAPVVAVIAEQYEVIFEAVEVTLQGRPGTRVLGIWEEPLTIDEDAQLVMYLPGPATYRYRALMPGRYPDKDTFYLGYDPITIELEQPRGSWFSAELYTANIQFLGGSIGIYLLPNYLYLRTGVTTYVYGLYMIDEDFEEDIPDIIDSSPLSQFHAQIGTYINQPDSLIRLYSGLGVVARYSHKKGQTGIAGTAPFGFFGTLGTEFSPYLRTRFFLEWVPVWYPETSWDEFREVSFPHDYEEKLPFGYMELKDRWMLVHAFNFHLGVRFLF